VTNRAIVTGLPEKGASCYSSPNSRYLWIVLSSVAEVLGANVVVSKLGIWAPITSCPRVRDMYGRKYSVQELVHSETSTMYFRIGFR
jgi:hypothetical protein